MHVLHLKNVSKGLIPRKQEIPRKKAKLAKKHLKKQLIAIGREVNILTVREPNDVDDKLFD